MLRFIVIDHLYFSPSITTNYRQNDLTSLAEKSIIMNEANSDDYALITIDFPNMNDLKNVLSNYLTDKKLPSPSGEGQGERLLTVESPDGRYVYSVCYG